MRTTSRGPTGPDVVAERPAAAADDVRSTSQVGAAKIAETLGRGNSGTDRVVSDTPHAFFVTGGGDRGGATPASASSGRPLCNQDGTAGATPTELMPGATIGGRYRLMNLVGADESGHRYWRARDTVLPRDVAVTLLPDGTGASATVAMTVRAGRLHHISLPQTLDMGTDHGQFYLVNRWIDGATLPDLLSTGPLAPEAAISVTAEVSEALADAHRSGIALGAITPGLIRVNIDGQVRFSHIVAHGTATPDQDIRAVGALLYLMLTGTWPLPEPPPVSAPAGQAPTTIPRAPTRRGRELPADEINPAVPEALSALAERAVHPEEPDGIHAIAAVAALLRKPQAVAHTESPPPPGQQLRLTADDRRLINERRMKLSLAAVILVVFAMLIVIAVGGLANQFLASVDNSAPGNVQMIDADTSPSAQPAGPAASSNTAGTNGQSPTSGTTLTAATVPIVDGTVYDPQGDGKPDYKSYVDRAYDGNPDSAWLTWVYKQQFPSLKTGVGLMLQLQQQTTPSSVQISSSTPGTTVEIRSATGPAIQLDQTTVLGSGTVTDQPLTITLTNPPKSNYILVFVTRMSKTGDNQYQSKINEIAVAGN